MDPSNSPAHLNLAEQDLQQDLQPTFSINVTTKGTKVAQSKPTEQDKPGVEPIMVHMNLTDGRTLNVVHHLPSHLRTTIAMSAVRSSNHIMSS